MPTLDLTPDKARELLELAERRADAMPNLTDGDRRNLRDLAAQLRCKGVRL